MNLIHMEWLILLEKS